MTYLIFNSNGELLDVLNLTESEVKSFKNTNPTLILVDEKDITDEDNLFEYEDDEYEW